MDDLILVLLPDEQILAFLEACENLRHVKVANIRSDLRHLEDRLAKLRRASESAKKRAQSLDPEHVYYSSADEQRDGEIGELQAKVVEHARKLASLEANDELCIPYLQNRFEVGHVGALFAEFKVIQVVDETSAIIEGRIGMPNLESLEEEGISALCPTPTKTLLRGIDTRRWADGDCYSFDPEKYVFACTGTYRCRTIFGTRSTIRVLELFNLDKAKRTWLSRKANSN
jgi:hypothetical protein